MQWINFLHLYQPANTDAHIIKEATDESYTRIIRAIEEHDNVKFTMNIQGCLFLRWDELGYSWLIEKIARLVNSGKIDLTGTAAYHALLPLIPEIEIEKQIKEHEEILQKYIGKDYKPKGFFLPEMAYSKKIGKIVKKLGYEWIILDEIAMNGKLNQVDFTKNYIDKNSKLKVIFRSREKSLNYIPDLIDKQLINDNLLITATDGELYGLRHIDHTAVFEKILKDKKLETKTISKFLNENHVTEKIDLVDSSWESTEKELEKNQPFILWKNKKNKIHNQLWDLANLTIETINKYPNDSNHTWARWHLVRGLASCTFWWAAARDFKLFSGISWNPDQIERGINELIRAIRSLEDVTTRETKIKAEKMYIKLKQNIWTKHWKYYWKK